MSVHYGFVITEKKVIDHRFYRDMKPAIEDWMNNFPYCTLQVEFGGQSRRILTDRELDSEEVDLTPGTLPGQWVYVTTGEIDWLVKEAQRSPGWVQSHRERLELLKGRIGQ